MIEYLLLMLVVVTTLVSIYNSDAAQDILSREGSIAQAFKKRMVYSYRHALPGAKKENYPIDYTNVSHDSYRSKGGSRFFGPNSPYPAR